MDARAFAAELREPGTLYLLHQNADPDCLGAAFALQRAFGGVLGAPGGLNAAADRLRAHLGVELDRMPHPRNFARAVAVDTSSGAQVKGLHREAPRLLLVDHHAYGDLVEVADAAWRDPTRSSACEVVLDLLEGAGAPVAEDQATALACGIVTDTDRFRYADARTFAAMTRVLPAAGRSMGDLLDLLRGDPEDAETQSRSRRIARLKAAQRAEVAEAGDLLVAYSRVGAHDAAAAQGLVQLGADVALVLAERATRARVSARAHPRAAAHGLHLGEILHKVASAEAWSGGGHEASAGMNGRAPGEPVLRAAVSAVCAAAGEDV